MTIPTLSNSRIYPELGLVKDPTSKLLKTPSSQVLAWLTPRIAASLHIRDSRLARCYCLVLYHCVYRERRSEGAEDCGTTLRDHSARDRFDFGIGIGIGIAYWTRCKCPPMDIRSNSEPSLYASWSADRVAHRTRLWFLKSSVFLSSAERRCSLSAAPKWQDTQPRGVRCGHHNMPHTRKPRTFPNTGSGDRNIYEVQGLAPERQTEEGMSTTT